ncbi:aldo/keto reductase [Acrocarpospora catenulata]|uniref:aldo/keto reductase n=1 Tax=Acrocarpospora catenulata TaxID=2836182 RepID=UPI001BD9310F|nr:aldo/keto reductase [Acrocarpospora catenulata]
MSHRILGRTGLQVTPLTLGTLNLGHATAEHHETSRQVIHTALDAGINVIDTADSYFQGQSEEVIGEVLAERGARDDVLLATKFFRPKGGPLRQGGTRRWIFQAVELSLRRLRTDYIDIYQSHRPDELTDIDETLGALTDLVSQGKIRYFGTSTFEAHQLVEAQLVALLRHRERPATEQPPYSILVRGAERAVLPVAEQYGIGVLSWSPLAAGWLSGSLTRSGEEHAVQSWSQRLRKQPERTNLTLEENQRKLAAVGRLSALADEAGLTLIELAIAFVLHHRAVSSAIVGPRTADHLRAALSAPEAGLDDAVLDAIDEIVPPGSALIERDQGHTPLALQDAGRRRWAGHPNPAIGRNTA